MTWTVPSTAVAGDVLTAAFWNSNLRDQLLETETAKASSAGMFFAGNGLNNLVARKIAKATVSTSQTTTSATFTDLATSGPSVTVTTGDRALVILTAVVANNSITPSPPYGGSIAYAVSGATTYTPTNAVFNYTVSSVNGQMRSSVADLYVGLTPGSNTFTMKYASYAATGGTGTATFADRSIIVWPF